MSRKLFVKASIANDVAGAPDTIVFLPEGTHKVWPENLDKEVTITVNASVLATFQQSLEERPENPRPYIDFDHKRGPASAIPKGFRYEEGKGLLLDLEWTAKGRQAIEGRDYSYFSPEFLFDPESGMPVGLRGRGPLGGLVNEPAFEEIPRIAAKKNGANNTNQNQEDMEALATIGLLSKKESSQDDAVSVAAKRVIELKESESKLETLEVRAKKAEDELETTKKELATLQAKAEEDAKANAEIVIQAAIADGKLKKDDEATIEFWRNSVLAQGQKAIDALQALPSGNEHLKNTVVKGQFGAPAENPIVIAAKKAEEAGESVSEAVRKACALHPDALDDYRTSLAASR